MKTTKTALLALFALVSTVVNAQNGGQSAENNSIRLRYESYANGVHMIWVVNKANCPTTIRFESGTYRNTFTLPASDSALQLVTAPLAPAISARAKRTSGGQCIQQSDNGCVEISSHAVLPVRFTQFFAKRVGTNTIQILFEVEEDNSIKEYRVKYSTDGRNYRTALLLFPKGVQGLTKYIANISIK